MRAIKKVRCYSSKKRMGVRNTDLVLENLATGELRHSEPWSN